MIYVESSEHVIIYRLSIFGVSYRAVIQGTTVYRSGCSFEGSLVWVSFGSYNVRYILTCKEEV